MACGRQQCASSIRSALQQRSLRCNSGWASSLTLAASTWAGRTRGHCAASVSGGGAHRLWGCTALHCAALRCAPQAARAHRLSSGAHKAIGAHARPRGGVVYYLPSLVRGGLAEAWAARRPAMCHASKPTILTTYSSYYSYEYSTTTTATATAILLLLLLPAAGPLEQSSGPRSAGLLRLRVRVRAWASARARARAWTGASARTRAWTSASARARARLRVGASLREAEARSRLLAHSVRPGLGQA